MITSTISITEEKNKKKGLRVSIFFHIIIVALALYPFLGSSQEDEVKLDNPILISFTDFDSASKKSAKGNTNKKDKPAKKNTPATTTKKEEVKPVPVVVPEPERKPIVTAPDKEVKVKEEVKKVEAEVKEVPKPKERVKVDRSKRRNPAQVPATDKAEEVAEVAEKPSRSDSKSKADGDSDGLGGSAEAGKDVGEGNAGEGDTGMDFSGDGIFGRKVVYRADVKKLTKKQGKIVINLCVNREGRVVYSKYNPEGSTITDKSLIRDTELTTGKYRFDKDYTADAKQCGKLTFIFDID